MGQRRNDSVTYFNSVCLVRRCCLLSSYVLVCPTRLPCLLAHAGWLCWMCSVCMLLAFIAASVAVLYLYIVFLCSKQCIIVSHEQSRSDVWSWALVAAQHQTRQVGRGCRRCIAKPWTSTLRNRLSHRICADHCIK